jgi:hypothetical protein
MFQARAAQHTPTPPTPHSSKLSMVMKKRENIKKKYQPGPCKIIINTCLLLFFSTGVDYGSSLYEPVANGKKALSRGSTLKGDHKRPQKNKKKIKELIHFRLAELCVVF